MTLTHTQQERRAAFTLVELLVVIGLLAVFATISVAGYSAASRGMADRGVVQSTVSILRIAKQASQIDRVPTKVVFFNQKYSDDSKTDETPLYQGTAIAIKQAGRITIPSSVTDGLLIDEFADWQNSYPDSGSASTPNMRIFQMKEGGEGGGLDNSSSLVRPFVSAYKLKSDYMLQAGTYVTDWCDDHSRNENGKVWGFKISAGISDWKVGDPYGVEIARIDLPQGYIFGKSAPNGNGLEEASDREAHFGAAGASSSVGVSISAVRPAPGGKFRLESVGKITDDMLKDN